MLAGVRFDFLVVICIVLAVAAPAAAQVNGIPPSITTHGVPPSVTSLGFGGSTGPRGVPPSVTSLPRGYNNPERAGAPVFGAADFFLPTSPRSKWRPRKGKDKDKNHFINHNDGVGAVGVFEPAYAPFAVPYDGQGYEDDADESDADDAGDNYVQSPQDFDPRSMQDSAQDPNIPRKHQTRHVSNADNSDRADDSVVIQPSTVLVFKDGHQLDVLNYAIVDDTLFDFVDGRTKKILLINLDLPATRKVNDDRGVDFQLPVMENAKASGQ